MDTKNKSVIKIMSFNVYFNALTGLLGISTVKLEKRLLMKFLWGLAIFSDSITIFFTILSTVRLVSPDVPLTERCITFLTNGTYLQSLAKLTYFYARRGKFQRFCDTWDESFVETPHQDVEQHMHNVERRKVKVITISLLVMIVFTAVPWCFLPIFHVLQDYHGGRYLNVPIWVPFIDIFQSPFYEVVLITTAIGSFFTTTKTIAYDGFFFSLVSAQIVKLQHMKYRMGKMFESGLDFADLRWTITGDTEDLESAPLDGLAVKRLLAPGKSLKFKGGNQVVVSQFEVLQAKEDAEITKRLAIWVEHHQQAMMLGELLTDLYSPMIMAQFVTTTLILCFTAFVITSVHLDIIQYVLTSVYTVGNILQLYLLCHYGDRLSEASVSLSEEVFLSGWHYSHVTRRVRSSLVFILQRVQKPLTFAFYGLYPLTAETFVNIMQGSISYLMILFNITEEG